jgi:CBS domain-containing protein
MPNAFPFDASPFDCLSAGERALVRRSVDIVYYPADATILTVDEAPAHLLVIIKGVVQQLDGQEVIAVFGPEDCFDARGLMAGRVSNRFVAAEEVIAYLLPRDVVGSLISANATFAALLFADLSNKLNALAQRQGRHELQSLTLARVDAALIRPPWFVAADLDIVSVVHLLNARGSDHVLVRPVDASGTIAADGAEGHAGEGIGIFTNTDLQRAIVDGRPLNRLAVAELANFSLVTVQASAHLFDALLLMVRHDIHRLVVMDGTRIVGLLLQLDLISFLSNHSHLISLQIANARSIEELARAAAQMPRLIALLHSGGTRVEHIARLVGELNAKLFDRTWQLIAPPDLVEASCLLVMGSEGRGEQLLRTDQDNGLIIRDGFGCRDVVEAACDRFSAALAAFGYPECPGGIMLSRTAWRGELAEFSTRVREWLWHPDGETLLSLAIFMDARAVSGDVRLLARVRAAAFEAVSDDAGLLARFAAPVVAFGESSPWWSRLIGRSEEQALDLKRAGIFPIVQGVRALALEARIADTSTQARLEQLLARGVVPADLASDLNESLHVLMGLKLKAGLADLDLGRAPGNAIDVTLLSTLERDLLKDTLAIVKRFRAWLIHHYRLDALA